MWKLKLTAEAFLIAVILNALVFFFGSAHLAWTPTIAGTIILVILVTLDEGQERTFQQSVAYGATCGFVLATAAVFPITQYLPEFTRPIDALTGRPVLPALWLAGAAAFITVDRVRNNTTPTTVRIAAVEAIRVRVQEAPLRPEPMPLTPEPAPLPAGPVQPPIQGIEVKAQPVPKGKPATIFLNLVGTGIACLRPVQAEQLGREFYRIVEVVPEGEEWEFQTGQIVRCRKQRLSNGKGMVAFEEAPRVS